MLGDRTMPTSKKKAQDTIVAIATPPGKGAIGIVRLSGPASFNIAGKIGGTKCKPERGMHFTQFYSKDGDKLDRGLMLVFPQPNSFSGEDMVEFHVHGNPLILEAIIEAALATGARRAKAGEFSRRAYKNDKIDLAQAESIADLINSDTEVSMRAAFRSLNGDFSMLITELSDKIIGLRVYVEATLDFPTDEIDLLKDKECISRADEVIKDLQHLLSQAKQGSLISSDINLAIIGRPNAGKSSLLNWLCRSERVIVSSEKGTTRDFVREAVNIHGMRVVLTDTAGIRSAESDVERQGIERTWRQAKESDVILLVYDVMEERESSMLPTHNNILDNVMASPILVGGSDGNKQTRDDSVFTGNNQLDKILTELGERGLLKRTMVIANKIDLLSGKEKKILTQHLDTVSELIDSKPVSENGKNKSIDESATLDAGVGDEETNGLEIISVSVKENEGKGKLLEALAGKCGREEAAPQFIARARHLEALRKCLTAVTQGYMQLQQNGAGELFAEDLKQANKFLDEILGETTTEDLLDRIFAGFCIGK